MYLSFNIFAVFTSALFASIAAVWMFAPKRFASAWDINFADSTGLVGRRAAALYYGIAMMFFSPGMLKTHQRVMRSFMG